MSLGVSEPEGSSLSLFGFLFLLVFAGSAELVASGRGGSEHCSGMSGSFSLRFRRRRLSPGVVNGLSEPLEMVPGVT